MDTEEHAGAKLAHIELLDIERQKRDDHAVPRHSGEDGKREDKKGSVLHKRGRVRVVVSCVK